MPTATREARSVAATCELQERLRTLLAQHRRRWRLVILLEAVGWAVALPLAYLWLVFLLDTQLHLPLAGRVLAGLGLLAGLAWATRHLARRGRQLRLGEDEVALAIERRTAGGVQNRLINAVQLARATGTGATLNEAVIQENYDRLQQTHLEQAAELRPAVVRVALAAAMIALGVTFWLAAPAQFGNAAARILLPLARIEPLYRTRLTVEPGDVEAVGELAIRVRIEGERPPSLTILRRAPGKLGSEVVAVEDDVVTYTFRDVHQSFVYAARGNDFTSAWYQVTVPQKASLVRVRATYRYPAYTGLSEKTETTATGELEAPHGSTARLTFAFDQPVEDAALLLDHPGNPRSPGEPLSREDGGKAFTGSLRLEALSAYHLEVKQGARPARRLGPFAVRVLKDREPKPELQGIDRRTEVQVDSALPLTAVASDDFGLDRVGLFFRRAPEPGAHEKGAAPWQAVATWDAGRKPAFTGKHELNVAALQVAEGDRIELAVRAADTAPERKDTWTTGAVYELTVGGDGVALQRQYEQILRGEKELKGLAGAQQALLGEVVGWLKKLDGSGDLRWDDPKNIDSLHAAVKGLMAEQADLQARGGHVARGMAAQAGNVRIAVGLLADAEMVRAQRILDSVATRDGPAPKRAALADARLTQERIVRSLADLGEQYALFRADWELGNMVPFTRMLADRQAKMRDQSRGLVSATNTAHQRPSMARRQSKVLGLCALIRPAFTGIAERVKDQEPILSKAFAAGAETLGGDSLTQPMRQAADEAQAGRWAEAARHQAAAADALAELHGRLRQAQQEAMQKALALLRERAKSDLEAQKELEKLQPGSADAFVKDYPDGFKVEDMVRVWEVAGKKKAAGDPTEEPDFKKTQLMHYDKNAIELQKDSGVRQDPYTLRLGTEAGKTPVLPFLPTTKEKNKVKPFIQEQFDDLVGKLLDEADELHKNYQSLTLSTNQNNNDPGEIGKLGGALNSTGAVAATGNKKPATTESGGVSRTGRQGARAYGMVADQDTFNRRGRDKALEGQEQVADQAGKNKMHKTGDDQKDTSTGVGGKKIESDDTHFSLHDAGKWKDEYAGRMDKPQAKSYLVERQGDRLDPKVAAQLRDLTSKQEQVIERLKAIKKELKNLYLPTDHLDDLLRSLQTSLDSLKERPEPELFRTQVQTLDRLRGALRVFQSVSAGFQPSLPRDRAVRGRVLDEPARPPLPGYEEAVRQYYLKLAGH